ncbi:MAG: hypothetical protein ABI144_00885 [Gallionella sp.]
MKEILGLAVLTSPLFLVVPWLIVAMLVAVKVSQLTKMGVAKLAAGAGTFVLVFLLPFSDDIAGRIYLKHLCSTEAGAKVYQMEVLPAEYWDAQGQPRFINARGVLDMRVLGDRFKWQQVLEPYIGGVVKIDKWRWLLQDSSTQKTLGEKVDFLRYFGWLNNFSPAPNIGEGCPNISAEQDKEFLLKIFKPPTSAR